ncbi:Concanavalin A-like lectin/glucanase [Klebsormidium nitens]|uniref:Concanavalin A-like lectin/glucanase n=1 Tax=Klebsormidium nitens TaxID=105231 RepID=A0A1Y1HQZ4_KLENI|nr:Concanavalin A-like lectin/glucanase [Klebsormidium nitens]|eukprot:GAQ81055.1 Concanavalin A-like lectin/glucanase [Klebsormidium nitens]
MAASPAVVHLILALFTTLFTSGSSIQIEWAGRTWNVRDTKGTLSGPGPNYFSDSPEHVTVDSRGNLRLQVTNTSGKWVCGELSLPRSLGYGTYEWTVTSDAGYLENNVILGLFTYAMNPEQNHREIDIEFGRFGLSPARDPTNAQFRWYAPPVSASSPPLVVSFTWTPGRIDWEARQAELLLSSKTYAAGDVPTPGPELTVINLWVYKSRGITGPINGKGATVYLSDFIFTPCY